MNIEEQIDNTLMNLKIIGMVQKNGRLCIRKGQLTLESDDPYQNIRRWFHKDKRDVCVMHIKNTINGAVRLKKQILANQVEVELREWTLQRLCIEMRNCQSGLQNLKSTYHDDAAVKSILDVLLERLQIESDWDDKTLIT